MITRLLTVKKKVSNFRRLFLLAIVLLTGTISTAQNVLVSGAIVGNGLYPDLGSAFTAINGGGQTGANIVVSILGNTSEATTATLNQNTWTTLSIIPAGGSTRIISGTLATTLVDLNGADRVLIDGLNTGGNSLTIDNMNTSTLAATIRFINDARADAVQNCTLLGASTSVTTGTVFFSTSSGGSGNDSIVFNNCTINASGANQPANGVFSLGTAGQDNGNITFSNCNIENFFSASLVSSGIFVSTNNTDWTISNCRFFQSASRTYTTGNIHRAIQIASGNNYSITGNTIGYATSVGTGTYTMTGTIAVRFIGIDLAVGTTTASSVQGNTVTQINLSTSSGAATTNGILCGINITSGNVNVGNLTPNIIGGSSGTNLLVGIPTTTQGMVVGINCSSTGVISIRNNIIGGLFSSGATAAVAGGIAGINISGVASLLTISGNTIGNSTPYNMQAGTILLTTGSSLVSGINLSSTPTTSIITTNTIQNLASYGTAVSYVRGIWTAAATASTASYTISSNVITNLVTNSSLLTITSGQASACGINHSIGTNGIVNGNTISNIANINTGTGSYFVAGITTGNATNATISNNFISNITNSSTSTSVTAPGTAAGIIIRSGATAVNVFNNMITLGTGATDNTAFLGIEANHGSTPDPIDHIYHNTINISGTVTSGAQPSFCFCRTDFSGAARTPVVDFKNNICTNSRTGGTGSHYAIGNNYGATVTTTGWGANASNNNVLNANASTIGWWGTNMTFAAWQTASASDVNSYSGITVTYVNAASNLHLNMGVAVTSIESGGQTIASVTTDIDGDIRPGPVASVNGGSFLPDIGADEFDGVPSCIQPTVSAVAATPTTICAGSNTTLNVTGTLNGATSWQWYTVSCGGTSQGAGTSISVSPTVTTTYFVRGEGGCSTPLSCTNVTVTVNPLPTVTATPSSPIVCNGASVTLTGGGATTYSWNGPQTITDNTPFVATISGTYTVTGIDANGCMNTANAIVTVNPLPTVTATPSSSSVCDGSNLTLMGGGATTYSWNGPQTITDNTPFVATTSGTYTVTGTDANGCVNTANATVTVNPLPTVTATPSSPTVCDGTNVTLMGGGATTYSWSGPQTITDNTPFIANISGTYTVTGTDVNGCVNTANATVTVNPLPTVTATPSSSTVCDGTNVTLMGGGATTYSWNGPQTITDNTPFAANISGTYAVTGTDANGCDNTASATVTVNSLPTVVYSETQTTTCINWSAITLTPGSPAGGTYNGTTVAGNMFDPATAGAGNYTITYMYTDANGCSNSDSSVINVDLCLGITNNSSSDAVNIYPNPSQGFVTIDLSTLKNVNARIQIVNVMGELVQQEQSAETIHQLDLSLLANGVYLIKVQTPDYLFTRQLIIQK